MSIGDIIAKYLAFLLEQLQGDIRVVSTPWVVYTVVPFMLYLVFFCIKWWMLLVPVTMPLTLWLASKSEPKMALFKKN